MSEDGRTTPLRGSVPTCAAETVEDVLSDILPSGHRCGPVMTDPATFERLEAAFARKDAAQALRMPDDKAALDQMHDAYTRLEKLGWRSAIYCPKDGTSFDAIEAGSTGISTCHYEGDWPTGRWWVEADGDLWPSRPILFRLRATTPGKPSSASEGVGE